MIFLPYMELYEKRDQLTLRVQGLLQKFSKLLDLRNPNFP